MLGSWVRAPSGSQISTKSYWLSVAFLFICNFAPPFYSPILLCSFNGSDLIIVNHRLFLSVSNPLKALSMKKKRSRRALPWSSAHGFIYNNEKYAGLNLNFRRWSGINSRAGKSGVAIAAFVFMVETDGTVRSRVRARNSDDGFSFFSLYYSSIRRSFSWFFLS